MKGISAVVATILMLLITITLAGVAYTFMQGTFTRETQGVEIIDSYCSGGSVSITIRNLGTENVTSLTCSQTAPTGDTCQAAFTSPVVVNIAPGATQTFTDGCSGSGARTCIYRIIPPTGRTVTASAACAS